MRDLQHYVALVDAGDQSVPERLDMLLEHRDTIRRQIRELTPSLGATEYKITSCDRRTSGLFASAARSTANVHDPVGEDRGVVDERAEQAAPHPYMAPHIARDPAGWPAPGERAYDQRQRSPGFSPVRGTRARARAPSVGGWAPTG